MKKQRQGLKSERSREAVKGSEAQAQLILYSLERSHLWGK